MPFTPFSATLAAQTPWLPSDNGLTITNNAIPSIGGNQTMAPGTLYLIKLYARTQTVINKLIFQANAAGVGASTGSFGGLYSSAGALLTGSADIGGLLLNSFAPQTIILTTGQTIAAGSFCWGALLCNLATTQASPSVNFNNGTLNTLNQPAAAFQYAVNGTGLVALPGSITPASNTAVGSQAFWLAGSV
jgi:hypothetical protein